MGLLDRPLESTRVESLNPAKVRTKVDVLYLWHVESWALLAPSLQGSRRMTICKGFARTTEL